MIEQQILDQDGDEMTVTCDGELVTIEMGQEIRQFRRADWIGVVRALELLSGGVASFEHEEKPLVREGAA